LTESAKKLLAAVEHTSKRVEGTQEVRRLMRWCLHSYRVVYGQCMFVTFSPSEKHSLLMIRLSRTRQEDPVVLSHEGSTLLHTKPGPSSSWAGRDTPSIEQDLCAFGVEMDGTTGVAPSYSDRRSILARDPLCCSDGFRVLRSVVFHVHHTRLISRIPLGTLNSKYCHDANHKHY